jgi:hypothetical protein
MLAPTLFGFHECHTATFAVTPPGADQLGRSGTGGASGSRQSQWRKCLL